MRATHALALGALLAIAGCATPAETAEPTAAIAQPAEPFHDEGTWWVEPSTGEMSTHEIPLDLSAGFAHLEARVVARTTYVVDLPTTTGEMHVSLLDPAGEAARDAWLRTADETETTLAVDAPAAGVWTLLLEAYGGSGGEMGDSLSWVADGTA